MKLTNIKIKNAQPKEKAYKLSDGKGLYLLINPNGTKYWRMAYRFHGKQKLLAIGVYPTVSLLDARTKCEEARITLSQNLDPVQEKKAINQSIKNSVANTFEQIANEWIEHKCKTWTAAHHHKAFQSLEKHIFPFIGTRPIDSIEPLEMLRVFQRMEAKGILETTKKVRQRCGEVFRYAIITGRCKYNPCSDLSGALQKHQPNHYSFLLEKDLPAFLARLSEYTKKVGITGLATRLLMLTGVRTTELRAAEWAEFDLDAGLWEIPAQRMKKRKPHIVPLPKQAIEILKQIHEYTGSFRLVFIGRNDTEQPISDSTILRVIDRMGYRGKVTGHGFRHTMSTILHEHNFNSAHIELQLAHVDKNSIRGTYNHAQYLEDRRTMLQWYADYLDGLESTAVNQP